MGTGDEGIDDGEEKGEVPRGVGTGITRAIGAGMTYSSDANDGSGKIGGSE